MLRQLYDLSDVAPYAALFEKAIAPHIASTLQRLDERSGAEVKERASPPPPPPSAPRRLAVTRPMSGNSVTPGQRIIVQEPSGPAVLSGLTVPEWLSAQVQSAMGAAFGPEYAEKDALITAATKAAKGSDYQCNAVLPLAKQLGLKCVLARGG